MTEKIGNITLDYKHYPGEDLYCDGSVEDELLALVQQYKPSEYGKLIEEKKSWPILYHLSSLRGNIVEWIPFEKNSKVLEVGSGCGAITGTLAEKAGEVTCIDLSKKRSTINAWRNKDFDNVTIHVGNFQDIEPELSLDYDYIFLIGVFEYGQGYIGTQRPYETFMRILKKHLKPDGRMIIAIENKFGLKYWAGCREDHLGRYFAGLEDYPEGGVVRTFTRKGLEKICADAEIKEYSFYYPYPDYKFMSCIYSDSRLPQVGELSNNMRNFDRDRLLLFDEKNVFDTIIREGEFPLYSNSYLLVVGKGFPVKYVKYSNDRARQFQIRTDIYEQANGGRFVKKLPLSKSATAHVAGIYTAAEKLTKKYEGGRLSVNRCQMAKDGVFLEYLYGRTLEELLDERLDLGDEEGFDRLVSEYVRAVTYRESLPVTDHDLIFSNIIVSKEGFWTILDYEWTFYRPCPGREVAGRALYCYLIGAMKRREISLRYLKERLDYDEKGIEELARNEAEFQQLVTGNSLSMTELRNKINHPILPAAMLAERAAGSWARKRVQIYEDTGNGFSEENSYFVGQAYIGQESYGEGNEISFVIALSEAVQALRIDPALECCLLTVRKIELEGDGVIREIRPKDCVVNGKLISDNTLLFDTRDPNLTIDFEKLKVFAGKKRLRAEFTIAPLPDYLAAEAAKGFEKKRLFGKR